MSVLQSWLEGIPLRMQSTLLLGLRGPDTHACPNVKKVQRWLRGLTFKPGNPDNVAEFMGGQPERIREKGPTAKELEFCSQHFYSHLMHALQVVGYKHPDEATAQLGYFLYRDMVELMHLESEVRAAFEERLKPREWPGGGQPDNFDEAMALLEPQRSSLLCEHGDERGTCLKC